MALRHDEEHLRPAGDAHHLPLLPARAGRRGGAVRETAQDAPISEKTISAIVGCPGRPCRADDLSGLPGGPADHPILETPSGGHSDAGIGTGVPSGFAGLGLFRNLEFVAGRGIKFSFLIEGWYGARNVDASFRKILLIALPFMIFAILWRVPVCVEMLFFVRPVVF